MTTPPTPDPDPSSFCWQTVLRPHRSLSRAGFRRFMVCLGVISLGVGLFFVHIGAWPVCGFFGLDVLLIYWAFRVSYRDGKMRETLRLQGDDFTIERVSVRGEVRHWQFHPYWLRVQLVARGDFGNRLLLSSHGKHLPIAGFVTDDERAAIADEIKQVLNRYKNIC